MKITDVAANAQIDNFTAMLDGGTLKFYDGVPPATADSPLSGNTLLGTLGFGTPSFGAGVAGVATANAVSDDAAADASGTASFARGLNSSGTVKAQFTVGTSAADIILVTTSIVAGQPIEITSFVLTQPKG